MKRSLLPLLTIAAVVLPACCVFRAEKQLGGDAILPVQLENETVALVKYIAKDSDGDWVTSTSDVQGSELAPYCTGVWISENTFLTAAHCVRDIGKPETQSIMEHFLPKDKLSEFGVEPWNAVGQPVSYVAFGDHIGSRKNVDAGTGDDLGAHGSVVAAVDLKHDLALVDAQGPGRPRHMVAQVATSAYVGQNVHVVGHTIGLWWTYTHGCVAANRPNASNADEERVNALQISAPVFFGNSGGGTFNDKGELLGIVSWIRKGPSLGFIVRYDVVSDFLTVNQRLLH